MRSFLVLTDAGKSIGYGHLIRCRSIAAAFAEKGYEVRIIVQGDAIELAANERSMNWHEFGPVIQEAVENADIVVVDSLIIGEAIVAKIQGLNSRTVVVDDYLHRPYDKGVIVDWTVGAETNAYPNVRNRQNYLLGARFCALRPEFSAIPNRVFNHEPERVLVTFGGSDVRKLSCPVVERIRSNFPEIEVGAVLGMNGSTSEDRDRLLASGARVHYGLNAAGMRDAMDAADLAISGGGQTLYELACRGLPPVVVQLVDNQTADIKGFSDKGFAAVAGSWQDVKLLDCIVGCIRDLWERSRREVTSAIGRGLVDGRGASRLVDEIERRFGFVTGL
jgi:UDP-2,4-diacetamido-2,4,6-trideoxy-beta-L-altropyranose hydrolase